MKSRPAKVVFALVLVSTVLVGPSFAAGNGKPICDAVSGDYIVTLTKGASVANEIKNVNGKDVAPKFVYDQAINGYAAFLTAEQVCVLQKRPTVSLIEQDGIVTTDATTRSFSSSDPGLWGLDRIDQPNLPLLYSYTYSSAGSGVDAYVVDSGILASHEQIAGRVSLGFSAVGSSTDTTDCNGHGTHVSGTIGGKDFGVAPSAQLIPVRVFGCSGSGTTSGVIAGLNWIINNHGTNKAVANMSLGGGASNSLDNAVNNVIADGVVVVVAAGNSSKNACLYSPARVPNAVTVAASTISDGFASYSNNGKCVDLIAPGSNVKSSYIGSNSSTAVLSGTSMATPHVTGSVARILSSSTNFSVAQLLTGSKFINGYKLLFISPNL